MSSHTSFWTRVGSAVRAGNQRVLGAPTETLVTVEPFDSARGDGATSDNGTSLMSLLPWKRRQKELARIDERYQRVVELMDAIRVHFEQQDRQAAELNAGVNRLGDTLETLATNQGCQSESLASIATQVNDSAHSTASLASTMVEMPASLQAQAEAVHAVARQMEATREADARLSETLRQFSQAADTLGDAGTVQVETLRQVHDANHRHRTSLERFVRRQSRLLVTITVIVAVLGLGAVAALAVVAHMIFNNGVAGVS